MYKYTQNVYVYKYSYTHIPYDFSIKSSKPVYTIGIISTNTEHGYILNSCEARKVTDLHHADYINNLSTSGLSEDSFCTSIFQPS